jgi:hypothetical protein
VNGAVSIGRCSLLTAEYRWAVSPRSQWTDTREEGALYGDVRGAGRDSTVYIQRRKDGPGFNAWVAEMSRFEGAMPWYLNAVPFDPEATAPTCTADTLCFDGARFLVADFDGDGRADLMVVEPRNGGTAFWLLRSNGNRFEPPRLWYQTDSAFTPATAQQYVAGDFNGDGRADVMIAQKRGRQQRPGALARGPATRRRRALPAGARRGFRARRGPRHRKREIGARRDADREHRQRVRDR